MSKRETLFRKYITKFGQLPLILLPMFLVAGYMYIVLRDFMLPLTIFILLGATLFVSYALGSIVKLLYHKPRPEPQHAKNWLQKIDASSFPSIHTANSMILAFWGILSVLQVGNQNIISYMMMCFWFIFFVTISVSRVVLKKHFPIDIVAGSIFGAICISIVMVNTDVILGIMDVLLTWVMSQLS